MVDNGIRSSSGTDSFETDFVNEGTIVAGAPNIKANDRYKKKKDAQNAANPDRWEDFS